MLRDSWLPMGFRPKDGIDVRRRVAAGEQWQIYETAGGQRVLVAQDDLANRWIDDKLLQEAQIHRFGFGRMPLVLVEGGPNHRLEAVDTAEAPRSLGECQALVAAIVASRACGCRAAFNDAVYLERLSRLLPDYSPNDAVDDALVAGFWTTGGVNLRLSASRRMAALVPWIAEPELKALAQALETGALVPMEHTEAPASAVAAGAEATATRPPGTLPAEPFRLPGRPHLEEFFNEHVVDIVRNEARYKALGITFPGAILLHGPPGCGKTFAVDALVDYLDWPSFPVDSGSVASPFIHDTAKKVAEVFAKAADAAPAIVVIDEIDAFLAARDDVGGHQQYRVEEVAEFLRGIPKAADNRVLVIGMTNRLQSLDPAVVRRGRFDHILDVGMPSQIEILSLLQVRMGQIPSEPGIDLPALAKALEGRPLSDLGFILKDACRRAARSGLDKLGQAQLDAALAAAPSRLPEEKKARRIGFI